MVKRFPLIFYSGVETITRIPVMLHCVHCLKVEWKSDTHLGSFPLYLIFYFLRPSPLYPRRRWHPTLVLLPGKSHGWSSLVGCSPWGLKESGTTERLHFHFSLSCIGEGNGNPLQCSCLENPRDGGACWAAIYGVAQSQTRLKQLSSKRECISQNKRG